MTNYICIAYVAAPFVMYFLLRKWFWYRMRAASDEVYQMLSNEWETTKSFMERVRCSKNVKIQSYLNSYNYQAICFMRTHYWARKVGSREKASISYLLYHLLLAKKVDMEIRGVSEGYILQAFEEFNGDVVAEQFLTKLATRTKESEEYIRKKQVNNHKKFVPTLDLSL